MQPGDPPLARSRPLNRFVSQPFRRETGDGAIVITRDGVIYRLQGVLGVGGLSIVYVATRYSDGERVALKLPNSAAKLDANAEGLLQREAEMLLRLDHPNIVRILDCGETTTGEPFIATELLRAQTVDLLMVANGGRLALGRAAEIVLQMADALQHAHERGVVHRDIKPANVLIRTMSKRDFITLFDFGIASSYGNGDDKIEGGSLLYASPEQLERTVCLPQSDVYQLALLFFEMVTGKLPFERSLYGAVQYRHGDVPLIPDNRELGSRALPLSLREFLQRSLSPSVKDRPCSMKAFAFELRKALVKNRVNTLRCKADNEERDADGSRTVTVPSLSASQS